MRSEVSFLTLYSLRFTTYDLSDLFGSFGLSGSSDLFGSSGLSSLFGLSRSSGL